MFIRDTWVHIAWVKEGTTYRFYKDGNLVATELNAPEHVQLSERYRIGHNDNYFVGAIDEVSFFDRALSVAEVVDVLKAMIHWW